ncbi:MAG: ABC-three component system protein [Angustibacter sp.]
MYDAQFERVVVELARILFGAGVQAFATGKDGGRDARFEGTAEKFPSTADPWKGLIVFQAKHTNGTNTHFSDPSFGGNAESSVLSQELPRVKRLVDQDRISGYVLAANRRLGAITNEQLKNRIANEVGIPEARVFLIGEEYLNDMVHDYPQMITRARVDPIDGPLIASSHDLAEVILAIATELDVVIPLEDAPVVDRVSFDQKNRINGLTSDFANLLLTRYLQYTRRIDSFLANPQNVESLRLYEGAVEDFQLKIVAHRRDDQPFDHLFNYLADLLISRDGVLARNKRLTRAILFYMYWHCDIGLTEDADSH